MIEFLAWDSSFFEIKIGRLYCYGNGVDIKKNINDCKEQGYKLVYIFCEKDNSKYDSLVRSTGAVLYDEKITFFKSIIHPQPLTNSNIISFESDKIPEALYKLGIQSGEYSRFKCDVNFAPGQFEDLYKKWVENSVNRTIADEVFISMESGVITGFVTLKYNIHEGAIGLIAVDNRYRGKAIGSNLISYTESFLLNRNIGNLRVVTQAANIGAVNFYKKNNFKIKEVTNIYHFWIT